jgi:hypothetical protein
MGVNIREHQIAESKFFENVVKESEGSGEKFCNIR